MILIRCPWCGPRDAGEFHYSGETTPRPDPASATPAQWRDYLYFPANPRGAGDRDLVPPDGLPPVLHPPARHRHQRVDPAGEAPSERHSERRDAVGPAAGRGDRPQAAVHVPLERRAPSRRSTGDTIASALAAAGHRVFSRSYKYHRPRGLLTASFHDPGCFFQVGDEPNVRGAHRLAEPAMDVRSQNTWPSPGLRRQGGQPAGRPVPRPRASTTRPSSSRSGCGRCTSACCSGSCTPGRCPRTRRGSPSTSATPTPTCWSPAAARPGWPPPSPPRRPARGSCWSRRSTGSAATCAGATAPTWPRWRSCGTWSRPRRGSRCSPTRSWPGRYDGNWTAVVRRGLPGGAEQLIKARAKVLVVAPGLIERPYVFAGQRRARGHAVDRRAAAHQPARGQAGRAGGGADRQRRRRRRRRRPAAGRGGGRPGGRRPVRRRHRPGPRSGHRRRPGGRARRRHHDRVRPAW